MNNKEAISIIKSIRENHIPRKTVYDDALELAIKALHTVDIIKVNGEWDKVTEAHEDIGYDRGFRDGYAQAVEERLCEFENDEEGRNHEQRY